MLRTVGVSDAVHEVVLPRLRTVVDELPFSVRDAVRYHLGWAEAGSPGKLVRPALTLLCAVAVGGTPESAVDPAVAVELVHNAMVLHDDVMNGALVRRHRETVWWRYGMPTAILAGDALLALASDLVARVPDAVSVLSAAVRESVHGHGVEHSFDDREQVTVDECLLVASAGTAALLRCACELGARYGGGQPWQVMALARFGWHLGVAYQLTDDLLGIWGDPREIGRAPLADLRAGRKTLPIVIALRASPELAEVYGSPEPLDDEDLARVAELIERAGGRDWARAETRRQCRAALDALHAAGPLPDARDALTSLTSTIADRA